MQQQEPLQNLESLFESAGENAETRLELLKLKATKNASEILSVFVSKLILLFILSIFIMVLNVGIALLLGDWMGKAYYGFFVLAAFYLIAGLIFMAFKNKWVKEPVANSIIKKIYS